MIKNLKCFFLTLFVFAFFCGKSQTAFNLSKGKSSKIYFKLINNIIIMPVELNGVKLSFVLDTGVSRPILFNLANMDSLQIKNTDKIFLRGLGNQGKIQAVRSKGNFIKIAEAIAINRDVSVVFDPTINFTSRLGVPVHGIIGYDIFRNFVVEINYRSKYIRLHQHESFKPKNSKRWETLDLDIYNRKPYLNAEISLKGKDIPVKLLIDSGGSDSVWLFENNEISINDNLFFEDYLGRGLSGSVYGKRSKLSNIKIGSHFLERVNVAFPDSASINTKRLYKPRNGSVAGNILKRFNIFFDYRNSKIHLKKNANFKLPFYYNNSGITVEQKGLRLYNRRVQPISEDSYGRKGVDGVTTVEIKSKFKLDLIPAFYIVELRETSNAKASGLQIGDLIIRINNKNTSELTLQQINSFFYDRQGKTIRIRVERNGEYKSFVFKLDDVFAQKKSLQSEDSLN